MSVLMISHVTIRVFRSRMLEVVMSKDLKKTQKMSIMTGEY